MLIGDEAGANTYPYIQVCLLLIAYYDCQFHCFPLILCACHIYAHTILVQTCIVFLLLKVSHLMEGLTEVGALNCGFYILE
jgi:hypothetical protein